MTAQPEQDGGAIAEHYDIIIIGSDAGGGTLAHTLVDSGKRILLLERGNFLPREMANWDPGAVFVDGRYISHHTGASPIPPNTRSTSGSTTEDLPMPENRVTVDGDGNVHLAYHSTNDAEADRLYDELKRILNHVGMADHHTRSTTCTWSTRASSRASAR
jgi:choline dehydrogenase-like flavoprotein